MLDELSKSEKVLFRTIAYWLRAEMQSRLAVISPAPDLLYDGAQSNFEECCGALAQVGMLDGSEPGVYWRVVETQMFEDSLACKYTRNNLDHLLYGLAFHSGYVDDLCRYREPITPTDKTVKEICLAMADCGYMEEPIASAFEWSDKFGPWLVGCGEWDLTEFAPAKKEQVNSTLRSLPHQAREHLSGSLCQYQPAFAHFLFAHWIAGRWVDDRKVSPPNDDWDLSLAAGLYTRLHSS